MARKVMVNGLDIGYIPPTSAGDVTYDNTDSGLTATTAQTAIDELAAGFHIYSTTEKAVGKWVNGEMVYEKSYEITDPTAGTIDSTLDKSTINVIEVIGGYVDSGDNANPFPIDATIGSTRYYANINVEASGVNLILGALSLKKLRFTMRYIKIS